MHAYIGPNGRRFNSTSIGGVKSDQTEWTQTFMINHPEYTQPDAGSEFIISAGGKIDVLIDDLEAYSVSANPGDLLWAGGDFESSYNGNIPTSIKTTSPGGSLTMTASTDRPSKGKYCAQVRAIGAWSNFIFWPRPYDASQNYILKGDVRVNSGKASLQIDFFSDEKRTERLGSVTAPLTESSEWQTITLESAKKYPEAKFLSATLVTHGDTEAFFDNVTLLPE